MNKNETPKQVKDRAQKAIRNASRQYGFPPNIERFLEATFPEFAAEFQRIFREETPPETARSAGLILVLNMFREVINSTTPPDDQSRVIRQSIGFMGSALLNAAEQPARPQ